MTVEPRKELLAELRTCSRRRVSEIVAALLAELPSEKWLAEQWADRRLGRPRKHNRSAKKKTPRE